MSEQILRIRIEIFIFFELEVEKQFRSFELVYMAMTQAQFY